MPHQPSVLTLGHRQFETFSRPTNMEAAVPHLGSHCSHRPFLLIRPMRHSSELAFILLLVAAVCCSGCRPLGRWPQATSKMHPQDAGSKNRGQFSLSLIWRHSIVAIAQTHSLTPSGTCLASTARWGPDRCQADNWINSSYLLTYTVVGRNDEKNPKDVRDGERPPTHRWLG